MATHTPAGTGVGSPGGGALVSGDPRDHDDDGDRRSDRQHEILDALEALFLAEGFRHFTIGDLVDRLRCSRRTLYAIAPSKEELVLVVIERYFNRVGRKAKAAAAAELDPGDAIAAYLGAGVAVMAPARRTFVEDLESYLPTRHLYDRHFQLSVRAIGSMIEDGIARGEFHAYHPALVAELFHVAAGVTRRPEVLARAGVSLSQAIDELSGIFRHGLLRERAAPPGVGRALTP